MKKSLLLGLLMAICFAAVAQEPLYRVRIASLKRPFDEKRFENLASLGRVTFEEADNGFTRVYLGNYLGKQAAKKVAALTVKKGYKGAYTVLDDREPKDAKGQPLCTTFQLVSAKNLDASAFRLYNEDIQRQVLISFEGGTFRISLGYYAEGDKATEDAMRQYAEFMGYPSGFSRKVGKGGAAPAAKKAPQKEQPKTAQPK